MGPILIDFVAGLLIHVVRVCEEMGKNSSQKKKEKIKRSNKWKRIKKNIELKYRKITGGRKWF